MIEFQDLLDKKITKALITEDSSEAHIFFESKVLILKGDGKPYPGGSDGGSSWIDREEDLSGLKGALFKGIEEKIVNIDPSKNPELVPPKGTPSSELNLRNYFYDIQTDRGVFTIRFYAEDGNYYSSKVYFEVKNL